MINKFLAFCPACRMFYSIPGKVEEYCCEKCHRDLIQVVCDYEAYTAMSSAEKAKFKSDYINNFFSDPLATNKLPFDPVKPSRWIGFFLYAGYIGLFISLILTIFAFANGGFWIGVLFLLGSFLSCGYFILFALVARDVTNTLNEVDRICHHFNIR